MNDAAAIIEGVEGIERLAKEAGVEMDAVLAHAGFAHTTWWRWKNRTFEPNIRSLRRLSSAIREIQAGSAA